jgi:hypothetical protein
MNETRTPALPGYTAGAALYASRSRYQVSSRADSTVEQTVVPQGCSFWKWLRCGAALAGCAAVCVSGNIPACIACLGGNADCVECLG